MIIYNFGYWWEWENAQKVTFDGENKQIIINPNVNTIDVKIDMYSAWKEWVLQYDNSKWLPAFRSVGGDQTGENQYAPSYFFLINNWKVIATNISCVVQMNLYSDDGLSPFVITNAAITNRASDVPIIKSEVEKRLEYGDKIYYDENSIYTGIAYPNGTIAQPINNITDAIEIAKLYNIRKFYVLSDVNILTTGNILEKYSIFADSENLTVNIVDNNYINNLNWYGFIINANFGGGSNNLNDCIILNALNISGQIKNSQINGTIKVYDNLVSVNCYSGVAGSLTPTWDMNSGVTTKLSIRSYSGGIELINCDTDDSKTTIELIAGQVKLTPTCSNGYIDIRGVGYITNNSSGSTIKTSGFVSEFPLSSEDIDNLAGLTTLTGITAQLTSIENEVIITSENVMLLTGMTENISNNIVNVNDTLSGITNDINDLSYDIKLILGLSQQNYRLSDHIYDGQKLTSVKINLYNNADDCDNEINSFATYQMNASYDTLGLLIDYKVIKL